MYEPEYKILEHEGEITIKPKKDIKYKLIAYKLKKTLFSEQQLEKKRRILITVIAPKFNKIKVYTIANDEEEICAEWTTRNTKKVKLSVIENKVFKSRDKACFTLDTTTVIKYIAVNKIGTEVIEERKIEIKYIDYPPKKQRIDSGDVAVLKWHYKKCNKVFFDSISTPFNGIDSITVSPKKTKSYKIIAVRTNNDTIRDSLEIKVTSPKINYFSAPSSIVEGKNGVLKWDVYNAKEIEIEGFRKNLPAKGEIKISPQRETKYKLIARTNNKTDSITRTVIVVDRRSVYAKKMINESELENRKVDFIIYNIDITKHPDEIKLYVLALDTLGNYIRNLAPPYGTTETSEKYFKDIVEYSANGSKQKVESFKVKEIQNENTKSREISLVMDYSGSMISDISRLEKNCKRYIANKLDNDYISVVKFDHTLSLEFPLTKLKSEIAHKLKFNGLNGFGGGTALYAGIDEGLISLENTSQNEKMMLLFTDGYENSSILHFGNRAVFAQDIARKARKNNVKINVVAIGTYLDIKLLKFMALVTGGEYYNAANSAKIHDILKELNILAENYYEITYKPTQKEGKRTVALKYNNNKGKTVKTEKSFFIGEKYDLKKYENNNLSFFGVSPYTWGKKKIIIAPQAAAHFSLNEYSITRKSRKRLKFFAKFLKENPKTTAIIVGHTDLRGTDKDCLELSKKRAKSVYDYLISKGISAKRLKTIGEGKTKPIWNPENKPIKAKENRRVEIIIFK